MNRFWKLVAGAGLLSLLPCLSQAKVTLPALFADGMVLQQQSQVAIWGTTDQRGKNVEVKTSWNNRSYRTQADADGRWQVEVETIAYGGPHTIVISDGEPLVLSNVLLGEV